MSSGVYIGTNSGVSANTAASVVTGVNLGLVNNSDHIPQIAQGNLIHYIDIKNKYCFPGVGSTVAKDLAQPPTVNVSVVGSPVLDFEEGGSLSFNKTAQWVTTPNTTIGAGTSNFTWGGWFNIREIDGVQYSFLLCRGKDTPSFGWSLFVGVDNNGFFWAGSVTTLPSVVGQSFTTTVKASPNTWYNLVGTQQNGVGLALYLNGNLIGSQTFTGTNLRTSSNGWTWGTNAEVGTNYFNGRIAITYAYERLLSPSEIMQNFNTHKKRFGY